MIKEPTSPNVGTNPEEAFYALLDDGIEYEECMGFSGYYPSRCGIAWGRRGPAFCAHERIHTLHFKSGKCQDCGGEVLLYPEDV